jgi:hypothetical protein
MDKDTTPQETVFYYSEKPLEKEANLFLLPIEQRIDHVIYIFIVLQMLHIFRSRYN